MVTEKGCLSEHSGANTHIKAGIHYLNHHFKVVLFTRFTIKRSLVGRNKDSFLFLLVYFTDLLIALPRQFVLLYKIKPKFIYERYHLLNFNTLLICRCLKIPHFFEINGLRKEYHQNGLLSGLETKFLSCSNFCFCLGLRGVLLSNATHLNIENGVTFSFWEAFKKHKKQRKIDFNICFLGTLMEHHRIEIIYQSLNLIPAEILQRMVLHFIGPVNHHMLTFAKSCPIPIVLHGGQSENKRITLLQKMDCGLVSGGNPYASFMKLFEYGSAKCPVIGPQTANLNHWLEDNCIFFYQPENPQSCANALMEIYNSPSLSQVKANRLYQLIGKKFLWEKIFSAISENIAHHL